MGGNIDARTPSSKLWKLAKALEKHSPQVEKCNVVVGPNGHIPHSDRAADDLITGRLAG